MEDSTDTLVDDGHKVRQEKRQFRLLCSFLFIKLLLFSFYFILFYFVFSRSFFSLFLFFNPLADNSS